MSTVEFEADRQYLSGTLSDPHADTDFPGSDVIALYANVDGTGGTIAGKPVLTLDQITAVINRSSYPASTGIGSPGWDQGEYGAPTQSTTPGVIQFGFQTSATMAAPPYQYRDESGQIQTTVEFDGFREFSAAQKASARAGIALWDDLVAYSFVETTADKADITYGNYINQPGTQAYAYLPYDYGGESAGLQGDVWVNALQPSNLQLNYGDYGPLTLIHETGHAIGLQHPGAYNAAPGRSITYAANAEYYQDSRQYTVMSYFGAENTGAAHVNWATLQFVYAQTPLIHDIATAQKIYGADPTTRVDGTVYGFNSTADRDVFDFSKNTLPVIAIYDAGGNDTLDFSGWNTSSTIDLNPGSFSSGGGSGVVPLDTLKASGILPANYTEAQYTALRARYNSPDGLLHDNISIAYGTIIENATGGGGNDLIIANNVANIINGGGGIDTVDYRSALSGVTVNLAAGTGTGGAASDVYISIENANGSIFADTLVGDSRNNLLSGGAGNDVLFGGAGNDTLVGGLGNDVLDGGAGFDTVSYADATGAVTVRLDLKARDTGMGTDSFVSIEGVIGSAFNDTIYGDSANNTLNGGAGDDRLNGGAGNDIIIGGAGRDSITGGAGADTFVFQSVGDFAALTADIRYSDKIDDFSHAQGDKIDLSGLGSLAFIGTNAFSASGVAEVRYLQGNATSVQIDVNGDGIIDHVLQLNATPLVIGDFILA